MPPIINAQGISKRFGAVALFREIAFTVSAGDRIGLIGPNGSGKSTLLGTLAGNIEPDSGEVALRKRARVAYVHQNSQFPEGKTAREIVLAALREIKTPESEQDARMGSTLGRAGFTDIHQQAAALSGGWRKRLAIAEALATHPDVLLLDEPTNHLDFAGIDWLEGLIQTADFACVMVSHDRYFLENVASEMVELNRVYADGLLRVKGNYSKFLEAKELHLEAQSKHQEALANRVKTEVEWLRRGPKARTTKSKARIDSANDLIGQLKDVNTRTQTSSAGIDFNATERQTKRLMELKRVVCEVPTPTGMRRLFGPLDFTLHAGMRLGLVGPNGSGKTSLLRLLTGEGKPAHGHVKRADALRIVYFDQTRKMDEGMTLRRALAPDSDSVVFGDRVIHVASWAARFLFTSEQLNQPVERLSGGERARVLIAKLMLQPADVLLLDEPTNDLDIPTLEILEQSLLEYPGALVLVTHDRYMLDRVSTLVLGLDGEGAAERFADYSQWDQWQKERKPDAPAAIKSEGKAPTSTSNGSSSGKKKLSYLEAREFASIEQLVDAADERLRAAHDALEDPALATDAAGLQKAIAEQTEAQERMDALYARWAELTEKAG